MNQASTLQKMMDHVDNDKRAMRTKAGGTPPRVICVTSGKGGVGKTNIVTNLAYALTKLGKKVLILDADLNLANVDVLLGLTPRFNLHHVLLGEKSLTEILVDGPGGFKLLPASSGIMELASLTESQKLYFMGEMETVGDKIDIMLVDTGAGINDNVIYFNLAAQERIIVLTPEPTSLTDAYALIKVLSGRHDVKRFRILINNADSEKDALTVFRKLSVVADRFLDSISLDLVGYIPFDRHLPKAVRRQKLVSELFPNADSSQKFNSISAQLIAEKPNQHNDGNIKFFWQGLLDLS
ncbi:MAG: MinD/ParA family protein [Desulfobulbaceae bacterium]|nr:MinD/ParA family protein [Desulfobulbaceae bacterium]